jgi:hypothetical protein
MLEMLCPTSEHGLLITTRGAWAMLISSRALWNFIGRRAF